MADEKTQEETPAAKADHEPPAGAETSATWTGGAAPIAYTATAKWLVLRKKEKPSAEIFSVSYVADGARRRSAGDVRLQRRPGRLVRLSPPRCRRPATGRLSRGRNAPGDAAAARAERVVLARLRRPRLRRSGGHGLQPRDRGREEGRRGEGRQEGGRDRPGGVLRAEARPRVALRVHGTVAVEQRPLGITGLHRGRELRRLPRRTHGADAAGERRDRAERGDPDLARARDLVAEPQRLRRPRLDRPAADHGGRRRAPRPVARLRAGHAAGRRAGGGGEVRHGRVRQPSSPAAPRWGRRSATASSPGWPI